MTILHIYAVSTIQRTVYILPRMCLSFIEEIVSQNLFSLTMYFLTIDCITMYVVCAVPLNKHSKILSIIIQKLFTKYTELY